MRTFCQGARDAIFRLLALLLVVSLPLAPSVSANGQTGDANTVVSAEDFPYALDFEQLQQPVFTGQYIASDPSIIVEDGFLRMFYTCFVVPETGFVPDDVRAGICSATSTFIWMPMATACSMPASDPR